MWVMIVFSQFPSFFSQENEVNVPVIDRYFVKGCVFIRFCGMLISGFTK